MLKKLFIIPWFGELPSWYDDYLKNIQHLKQYGYEWLFITDLNYFNELIEKKLGITPTIMSGSSKSHDFRTAFGLLFEKELQGYDYWGHTDLDCVYGDIPLFIPDSLLKTVDIHSNHHNYICGPWTLYKNIKKVNTLFNRVDNWKNFMLAQGTHYGRWTEVEFSQLVDKLHDEGEINRIYTFFQGKDPNITKNLSYKDGHLFDQGEEIMMFHFNRSKRWPL